MPNPGDLTKSHMSFYLSLGLPLKLNHKQRINQKIVFAMEMTRLVPSKETENKWEIAESDQKFNAIFKWKICQDT